MSFSYICYLRWICTDFSYQVNEICVKHSRKDKENLYSNKNNYLCREWFLIDFVTFYIL